MLARILPIASLLIAAVVGYFLVSTGMLKEIVNPSVTTIVASRDLSKGQSLSKNTIGMRVVSVREIEEGMLVVPTGTKPNDLAEIFKGQIVVVDKIEKGALLRSKQLGTSANIMVLRATTNIESGERIGFQNVESRLTSDAATPGAITFADEKSALQFIGQAYDLAAKQAIVAGSTLTVDHIAAGSERIYVIRTTRVFSRAEQFSMEGLEAVEISSRDIPRGAVAFPSRVKAEVYLSEMDRYFSAKTTDAAEVITAEALASDGGLRNLPAGGLPRTLSEMTAFMTAYPGEAMFVSGSIAVGGKPAAGEFVDVWVETGRTDGRFGEIMLERVASQVLVNIVYRNEKDAAKAAEIALGLSPEDQEEVAEATGLAMTEDADPKDEEIKTFSWVQIDPEVSAIFDKAQRSGKLAFVTRRGTVLTDQLGNGATCLDDVCRIDRVVSDDLAKFAQRFEKDPEEISRQMTSDNVLTYLDSVGPDLAEAMKANGYATFETVAAWTDDDIGAVVIELSIEKSHAIYIREQARIVVASAEEARKALGMEEPSTE